MIKETAHLINYEVRDAHLLTENIALNHPTPKSKKTKDFTRLYKKRGLYFSYYCTFYALTIKRTVKKILGDKIYNKMKTFLKK